MYRDLWIFDLDGTLADCTHRLPLVTEGNHDWDTFYARCVHDKPIKETINIFRTLVSAQDNYGDLLNDVWIVSGRSEAVREVTMEWLHHYGMHITDEQLMMRPVGDYRPDDVLKQEYLDNMLHDDRMRLVGVFDDRDKVVAMWRRNGVRCYQVAPGNF